MGGKRCILSPKSVCTVASAETECATGDNNSAYGMPRPCHRERRGRKFFTGLFARIGNFFSHNRFLMDTSACARCCDSFSCTLFSVNV